MKLNDFKYALPEELIAQEPLRARDKARLMVVDRKKKTIHHEIFSNITQYFPEKSCLVLNDSKVIPARLLGKRDPNGGQVEIFLLKRLEDGCSYEVLMRPQKRLKVGEKIQFGDNGFAAEIVDKEKRIVRFNRKNVNDYLEKLGHMPLPPYIKRLDCALDREYYQTVYARNNGSVAAPTAGLHFTNTLLNKIKRQGHSLERVTLHINYATFKPVEAENIIDHPMHFEDYEMTKKTFNALKKVKEEGRKIIAVGTTSCRTLESMAQSGRLQDRTNLFIYPGYKFQMIDMLITNFHLPSSTLLMLVYALGGKALMKKAYREAVKKRYRFFSYGDAMIIV